MNNTLLKPKFWGMWLMVGLMRLFVLLPYRWQMRFGRRVGRITYPFLKRRKHITMRNIEVAFPELNAEEKEKLCRRCFDSAGMAGVESMIAWFMPKRRFVKIPFHLKGQEAFEQSHNDPEQASLLLGCHFTSLEMAGRYIAENYQPFYLVYQKNRNVFFEHVITKQRQNYVAECFQRKNLFPIIRALKNKQTLWYAPDQDFGQEHTIFVPFFGVECATLTATTWLVQKSNAKVFPVYYVRREDLSGYDLIADAPWDNFPSGDVYQDALRYNQWLETIIRRHPDQYLWQHRRYKTRPQGQASIY